MQKEILIRTDGNHQMGHGHVVRCLSLALMLKEKFQIRFVSKELPSIWIQEISENFNVTIIKEEDEFIQLIKYQQIVVIDGYHFDTLYQQKIKEKEANLVVIDDFKKNEYFADLIINTAPSAKPTDYLAQSYSHYALGINYVLLRPQFLSLARREKKYSADNHLFICFGGSDIKNLTSSTYKIAADYPFFKKISIVTGSSYNHCAELDQLIAKDKRTTHFHSIHEKEMVEIMAKSDYALVPSSGILHEVIAAKCIPISGKYIDNQNDIYINYKNLNAIIDAEGFEPEAIKRALDSLPTAKVTQGLIDGFSGKRLLDKFQKLIIKKEISFRNVEISDVDITFNWAKNVIIRQFAFSKHEITAAEHLAWMKQKIADKNCVYFIIKMGIFPVGSIRFDISDQIAVISYLADSSLHGKGFGKSILSMGIREFEQYCKSNEIYYRKIVGYVKNDNLKSLFIFNDLNFSSRVFKQFTKFTFNLPSKNTIKVGLLLSGDLGLNCLKILIEQYDIPFVFTDKSSIKIISYCKEMRIPAFVGNPRTQNISDFLKDFNIDVLFSINYLFLIGEELIQKPKIIALNIHGSLLPKYRGRTPHVWSIIKGEKKTGVTVHEIDLGCDTGDILYQEVIPIANSNTGGDLLHIFKNKYPKIVLNILENINEKSLKLRKQNEARSSYFEKRTPEDGQIDWNLPINQIINWVRAISYPYPGAFTYYQNKKIIIDRVSEEKIKPKGHHKIQVGEIISTNPELVVKSKYGYLKIEKIRNKNATFEKGNQFSLQKKNNKLNN